MSSKVDIFSILRDHKNTLVDQNSNKPGGDDLFYFLVIPILLPVILVLVFKFNFDNYLDLRRSLVSSLAIFVGLLFNALVLLINIAKNGDTINIRKKVIQNLISNISFNIITALFAVLIVLLRFINLPTIFYSNLLPTTSQILDIITLTLLISFFITFLMIMKRTYLIINTEINKNT